MAEDKLSSEGIFSLTRIYNYLSEVGTGAYQGLDPARFDPVFAFFAERYDECAEDLKSGVGGKVIGEKAVKTVRDYLANDELSGELARNKNASAARAYDLFSDAIIIIERLESGESARDILDQLRGEDMEESHGLPEIQSP